MASNAIVRKEKKLDDEIISFQGKVRNKSNGHFSDSQRP